MLVIRDGTVVDAEGSRTADVAVEDGRITAVGDVPDDAATEVDAAGRVVAPGLVDAHVHLAMDGRPDPSSLAGESVARAAYRAAANLRDAVEAGVTTVRDLGAPGRIALDARAAVEAGDLVGPRVVAAGQPVVMTGGHSHQLFGREADGAAEVTKAAREQLRAGADVVKCMATGGVLTEGAVTGAPELDAAELTALVEAAAAKSVPTAAHAHGAAGIKNAVRAGITSVEHGTYMDWEAAELLTDADAYWVPTVSALDGIVSNGTAAGIPEWAVAKGEDAGEAMDEAFEHAIEAGVTVAMGTDAGTPFNFHGQIPRELELLVEFGLSVEAAFEAATVNAAALCGLEDVGLVREGYRADLVVLPADPREDETAYQDSRAVVADGDLVVADGEVVG